MADSKTTGLTATASVLSTDLLMVVTDPGGSPTNKKITVANFQASLTIAETQLSFTDVTTNNFSTTKHGFVPKGTNVGAFLKDDGTWDTPAGFAWGASITGSTGTTGVTFTIGASATATNAIDIVMSNGATNYRNGVNIDLGTNGWGGNSGVKIKGVSGNGANNSFFDLWANTANARSRVMTAGFGVAFTETFFVRACGMVSIGGIDPGAGDANVTNVLVMANGTAPSVIAADTVSFYSSDDAAGHTIPSFYCEGTNVLATGQADSVSSVRVKMRINGTVVTLLAI